MEWSLDGEWMLAIDPRNEGRDANWQDAPRSDAKPARVPWIIQDAFPGYRGVAWYWKRFDAPEPPYGDDRRLIRFAAVDYLATVWLNGARVGGHEGGETPFALDVTGAIRPRDNLLAVRVLNPTNEPIDGIVLSETPHRNKTIPVYAGGSFDHGGIVGSVTIVAAPPLRIDDLHVRPDPATGRIRVAIEVRNDGDAEVRAMVQCSVAPASAGATIARELRGIASPPGASTVSTDISVPEPRLWDLADPFLYRVTVRLDGDESTDERSVRCGFRDFRFAGGAFRLNGRRIWLKCSHTGSHMPVGLQLAPDPDFYRRDLILVKTMGFNAIRFIAGLPVPEQLDLCDELGLVVYEESYAAWLLGDSPNLAERFDRSTIEMIRRDRNHPCIGIWGLLNETKGDDPVFTHAVGALGLVRSLDDDRAILLASGRWDCRPDIGSLANPGSTEWEYHLGGEEPGAAPTEIRWGPPGGAYVPGMGDVHVYPRVPHTQETIDFLRTVGAGTKPVVITEYGIGSAVDLWRAVRHYERIGKTEVEDYLFYRDLLEKFLADWERWNLGEMFASPSAYFRACLEKMAGQRRLGLDAIRSNPNVCGHSITGTVDQGMTGEGLFTTWREHKPGTIDTIAECLAPVRIVVFATPSVVFRGESVRIEAVLVDEGALPPGDYPVWLRGMSPDGRTVLDRTLIHTAATGERPFAVPLIEETIAVDGEQGAYRVACEFERGAAPTGGDATFAVFDRANMPALPSAIALLGEDDALVRWLEDRGCRVLPFGDEVAPGTPVLVGTAPPAGGATAFAAFARHVKAGARAMSLAPGAWTEGEEALAHLPVAGAKVHVTASWLYLKDDWAKRHPIFAGLPSGGMMDYATYGDIIPDPMYIFVDPPEEAIAGGIKASQDYVAGLLVSTHALGAGRLLLSTLRIREEIERHPVAERLLRNMLRWAAEID